MAEAPQTPHRRARVAIPAVIAGGVSALASIVHGGGGDLCRK